MVGRVNAWKGQGDFLEAVTPILKANPKAVAFLAGSAFEGEEWRVDELEKAISDSPVAEQIKRIDYYSKTTELYNMFDIFVIAKYQSRSPTNCSSRINGLWQTCSRLPTWWCL